MDLAMMEEAGCGRQMLSNENRITREPGGLTDIFNYLYRTTTPIQSIRQEPPVELGRIETVIWSCNGWDAKELNGRRPSVGTWAGRRIYVRYM